LFCENNLYAEMTPISEEASIERMSDRGCAYGIPGIVVDGNDVEAVYRTTAQAVARARAGQGPTLIEAMTYRISGHMFGDTQAYRSKEEVESWRLRDPLLAARSKLEEQGVAPGTIEQLHQEVELAIEEAITFARQSPEPNPAEANRYVYLEPTSS
jgi:pyruvate dehydrogenase E1 component alpha subunit